jgi:hypothetical protein
LPPAVGGVERQRNPSMRKPRRQTRDGFRHSASKDARKRAYGSTHPTKPKSLRIALKTSSAFSRNFSGLA